MKPITRDIITAADDFFFTLSDELLEEKVEEFYTRQYELCQYLFKNLDKLSCGDQVDLMARLALVIDYCFNSYHIKLDAIELATIKNFLEWRSEKFEELTKSSQEATLTFVEFVNSFGSWGQDDLLTYLNHRLENNVNDEYDEKEDYDDKAVFMITLMSLCFIYQQELRKQMEVVN